MNWKQEGYQVGNTACLENIMLYSGSTIENVEIIYVGNKILKIKTNNEKVIQFNNSTTASGHCFGFMYKIYKSRKEYDELIQVKKDKENLVDKISKKLDKLSLEKLKEIEIIIEG
jgi:predicted ATP-binding protein involved in virulence